MTLAQFEAVHDGVRIGNANQVCPHQRVLPSDLVLPIHHRSALLKRHRTSKEALRESQDIRKRLTAWSTPDLVAAGKLGGCRKGLLRLAVSL